MIRQRDTRKRQRSARPALEPLEGRVELSGAGAVAGYVTAVDGLNGELHARVAQINAHILRRTARIDQGYQAAFDRAAGAMARHTLARSMAQVDRSYNNLVRDTGRRVTAFTRGIDARVAQISNFYGGLDMAVWPAVPDVETLFRNGASALGGALVREARSERDAARAVVASTRTAIARGTLSGAAPMAQTHAADLNSAERAQQASGQADLASVLSAYGRAFNALQSELMALPADLSLPTAGAVGLRGGTSGGVVAGLAAATLTGTGRPGDVAAVRSSARTTGTPIGTGTSTGTGTGTAPAGTFVGNGASRVGIGTGTTGIGRSVGTGTGTGTGFDATGLGGTGTFTGTGSFIGTGASSVGIGTGTTPTATGVSTGAGVGLGSTGVGLGSTGDGLGNITGTMTGGAVTTGTLTTAAAGPVTGTTGSTPTTDFGTPTIGATGLDVAGLGTAFGAP